MSVLVHIDGETRTATSDDMAAIASVVAVASPPLVPITRRQLRLTLLAHGLLAGVESAIEALPEPERSVAMIEWQDASEYQPDHPLIGQIVEALSIAPAQREAMWREAMAR